MPDKLMTANKVRDTLGGVSDMTLWRFIKDPVKSFPTPIYIGRRRYWREKEVAAWIDAQAAAA